MICRALVVVAGLWACGGDEPAPSVAPAPYPPSELRVDGDDVAAFVDVQGCASCHAEQHAGWQDSAHRMASFSNPYYRVSIERLRDAVGESALPHCGGCHDPALLVSGRLAAPDPADPLAHAGVTCQSCHGARADSNLGNASLTMPFRALPTPVDGDAASLQAHRVAARADDGVCVSCHRGFMSEDEGLVHAMVGQEDAGAHADSVWGGHGDRPDEDLPARTCVSCHMPDGDHRVPGGRLGLVGSGSKAEATAALWRGAVELYVAESATAGTWDVVLFNAGVGHRLPGGALDAQGMRLVVEALDADGRVVARDDAHALRAEPIDEHGAPVHGHDVWRFAAVAWDTTLAPRTAAVVRYEAPAVEVARVRARLEQRSPSEELARLACASDQAEPGWIAGSRAFDGRVVDGCAPRQTWEVATAEAASGEALPPRGALWRGEALVEASARFAAEARASLELAASGLSDPALAGRAALALARVDSAQGLPDAALRRLDAWPSLPGALATRGDVLAAWSRYDEAGAAYMLAEVSDRDAVSNLRRLAMAAGTMSRWPEALDAADRGLAARPRDPDLLRVRMLALRALGEDDAQATVAFERYREWEGAPAARARCYAADSACAREAEPAHTHRLQPVAP